MLGYQVVVIDREEIGYMRRVAPDPEPCGRVRDRQRNACIELPPGRLGCLLHHFDHDVALVHLSDFNGAAVEAPGGVARIRECVALTVDQLAGISEPPWN